MNRGMQRQKNVDVAPVVVPQPFTPDGFVCKWMRSVQCTKLLPYDESLAVGRVVQGLRGRSGRCGHGVSVYVAFWGSETFTTGTLCCGACATRYAPA